MHIPVFSPKINQIITNQWPHRERGGFGGGQWGSQGSGLLCPTGNPAEEVFTCISADIIWTLNCSASLAVHPFASEWLFEGCCMRELKKGSDSLLSLNLRNWKFFLTEWLNTKCWFILALWCWQLYIFLLIDRKIGQYVAYRRIIWITIIILDKILPCDSHPCWWLFPEW